MAIILKGMEIKCCAVQYRKKTKEERGQVGQTLERSSTLPVHLNLKKGIRRCMPGHHEGCFYIALDPGSDTAMSVWGTRPLYLQSFVHIPSTFPGLVTKYKHIVYSLFPLEIPSHPGKIQLTFIKSSARCLVILVPAKSCYVVKNWATCFLLKQNSVSHLERHTMFKCLHLEGQTNRSDGAANLRPI